MTDAVRVFDVAIAGGGVAGLALAAALKRALGEGVSIAVVDPAHAPARDGAEPPVRAVAIAGGPRLLLESLGAWEAIELKVQPILAMAIMDGAVSDAVRLPHLHFDAKGDRPLAHMAFTDDIVAALSALCRELGVVRLAASVAALSPRPARRRNCALGRRRDPRPPRGRGRWRALEAAHAGRHPDDRLGLRPDRPRGDDRA